MEKKRFQCILKWCLLPVLLLAIILCLILYNRIPGRRIPGVQRIDESCTITMTRWEYLQDDARQTRQLSVQANRELKQMLTDTTFLRTHGSGMVEYDDPHVYEIEVAFPDEEEPLRLRIFGGEYLSLCSQTSSTLLHIHGEPWAQQLENLFQKATIISPDLE